MSGVDLIELTRFYPAQADIAAKTQLPDPDAPDTVVISMSWF
jgi:hypothetical protein